MAYTFNKTAALTSFTWDYVKASNAGAFKVLVDGKLLSTVDCYAAAAALGSSSLSLTGFADGWQIHPDHPRRHCQEPRIDGRMVLPRRLRVRRHPRRQLTGVDLP